MGRLAFTHGAGDGTALRDPPPPAPSRAANFPRPAGLCYTGQWANGPGGDEHRTEAPMHDDEFSVTPLRPADSASPAAQPSAARPLRRFRGLRGRLGAASALALLTLSLCALLLTQLGGVEPLLKLAPLPGRASPRPRYGASSASRSRSSSRRRQGRLSRSSLQRPTRRRVRRRSGSRPTQTAGSWAPPPGSSSTRATRTSPCRRMGGSTGSSRS